MAGVFISYRREDSPGHAGRIFDRVRARFGAGVVFMDVTAIDAGVDFVDAIDRAVGTCDVLLAVIGPHWAGATDSAGRKRLDNPNDFIRLEIAGALKRNVRVVPVLVDDAQLPGAGDLPDVLQPLLRRNAVELRDARWDADIDQLIASLERIVKPPEEPLRLEAPSGGRLRWRWVAGIAALVLSVGAAAVWGPRVWTPTPESSATTTTPPPARPAPSAAGPVGPKPSPATPPPSPRPESSPAPIPNVVGRQLSEAREILRRAGVEVARVIYRDERDQAVDLVVAQFDANANDGVRAVVLSVIARVAVVIHHLPDDSTMARRLAGALTSSAASSGLTVRTLEMQQLRPGSTGRVAYSDTALADTAGGIAKEASDWLANNDPGRPAVSAALQSSVVSRTIVIGLPGRGRTTSSPSLPPIPDVRRMTLRDARRALSAAGITNIDYKWSLDAGRTPLEVFGQSEVAAAAGGRTAVLEVGAKGTLLLYYLAEDAPTAERFARALQVNADLYGVLVRPIRLTAPRPELDGKVASADALLHKEAQALTGFARNWFAKETGRQLRLALAPNAGGDSRRITFGLPSLQ